MPPIGPRQTAILSLLAAGPFSLAALIQAVDPDRPAGVVDCLRRLEARGLVEMSGRRTPKRTDGAMVRLAAPSPRIEAAPRSSLLREMERLDALIR